MIGNYIKKKDETSYLPLYFSITQWLQEDYGESYPTSYTGRASELTHTLGTKNGLLECKSFWCNISQGVCAGTSNLISTDILYCSLICLTVKFMLTQYTTSPKTSASPFQEHNGTNKVLAKKQVECLIY